MAARLAAALAVYLALAVGRTWPLARHAATHLPSDPGDPLLTTWIMAWTSHALATDPLRLFHANIAYPLERTLAFSDSLLGALPVFAPVYAASGSAILAANVVFLAAFALTALAAFALAYHWTGSFPASLLAGALLGWAPARLAQVSHVQLLVVFWTPLALLFLERFVCGRRRRDLVAFAVFFVLQALTALYLAFMLACAVAIYAVVAVVLDRRLLERSVLVAAGVSLAAMLAVLLPLHVPYLLVHRAWDAGRTLGAMAGASADLRGFLTAPDLLNDVYVSMFRWLASEPGGHERRLFPGLVLPALAVLGALGGTTALRGGAARRGTGLDAHRARRLRAVYLTMTLVALVLALGPFLVVAGRRTGIPLPYLILYHVVPGWSGMRVPARFVLLAVLAATPLAALGAVRLGALAARGVPPGWRATAPALTAATLLALFLLEIGTRPLPLVAVPTGDRVPAVYRWLATARPGPVLELPLESPADQRYALLSSLHWLPIVNGRSGFVPAVHEAERAVLATFPSPAAMRHAAALGVAAIVVHADRLDADRRARLAARDADGTLTRLITLGDDVVYAVPPIGPARSLVAALSVPAALPAGADVRLGIALAAEHGRAWAQRAPRGVVRARVEWRGAGAPVTATAALAVPLVVAGAETAPVGLRVTTPRTAGRYTVRVSAPRLGLELASAPVDVGGAPIPTSAGDGRLLRAAYDHPPVGVGRAASAIDVAIGATNTGQAVWLARAIHSRGEVALRWRWLAGERALDEGRGEAQIRHDVFPGQRYDITLSVETPLASGDHVLEVGLVAAGVTTFATAGSPPLRLPVTSAP